MAIDPHVRGQQRARQAIAEAQGTAINQGVTVVTVINKAESDPAELAKNLVFVQALTDHAKKVPDALPILHDAAGLQVVKAHFTEELNKAKEQHAEVVRRHQMEVAQIREDSDKYQAQLSSFCAKHPTEYECSSFGVRAYSELDNAVFRQNIICSRQISTLDESNLKSVIARATPEEKQIALGGLLSTAIEHCEVICGGVVSPAAVLHSALSKQDNCVEYGSGMMVYHNATYNKCCAGAESDDLACRIDNGLMNCGGAFHAVVLIGSDLGCEAK